MIPILDKTIQATLAKAKPQLVPVIQKVVLAGKKVMYDPKTRDMAMAELKKGTDPESIGAAVSKLMGLLMSQAKGTIPPEVLVPAAIIMLCEGLQFLQDAGAVQVTPDLLSQATKATGSAILQLLGVTPDTMQAMLSKQQGAAQPAGVIDGAKGYAAGGLVTKPPLPAGMPAEAHAALHAQLVRGQAQAALHKQGEHPTLPAHTMPNGVPMQSHAPFGTQTATSGRRGIINGAAPYAAGGAVPVLPPQAMPNGLPAQAQAPFGTQTVPAGAGYGAVISAGAHGGQADTVPIRAAGGEYMFDADTVAALGDGDSAAGAARLDAWRQALRAHKRSAPPDQIPPAALPPQAYLKGRT